MVDERAARLGRAMLIDRPYDAGVLSERLLSMTLEAAEVVEGVVGCMWSMK